MREFELPSGRWPLVLLGSWAVACASAPAPASPSPAAPAPSAATDAKAVMAQELGELPAPPGPCPERTEQRVLLNPRAAVHRTALGLAYCMLLEGPPGVVPGPNDVVKVNYSGWTEEGEMFDSSIERGTPMEFPLNGVIRGWGEGLRLMTPGDKARLWIPGNLAYGQREPGGTAGSPPKGTLIFEVELISVERTGPEPKPAAEQAPPAPDDDSRPRLTPRPAPSAASADVSGKRRRSSGSD